jgi:S1-C subfamily serine protease
LTNTQASESVSVTDTKEKNMRWFASRKLFMGLAAAGLLVGPALAGPSGDAKPAPAVQHSGRAYLGLAAEAQAKDGSAQGVLVHSVTADGPAARAGLKSGDRILAADGKQVKSFEDLKKMVAGHKSGDRLALRVLRDGKEQGLAVTLGEAPAHANGQAFLGVLSQPLTAELREHLGVSTDSGALVARVLPDSPAARAGLQEEDVITHVGSAAVNNPEQLREALRKAGAGKEVTLKVVRGSEKLDLKAHLEEAPASANARPQGFPGLPEGFENIPGDFRPFPFGTPKTAELEKKIQELENRIRVLESRQSH